MESRTLIIKNMVCPRCIATVATVLTDLGIHNARIELGRIYPDKPLDKEQIHALEEKLQVHGFELLHEKNSRIVQSIKQLLIKIIHQQHEPFHLNYSDYLSNALNYDYSHLSRLFSSVEGITIERYIIRLKIEKVKEYLLYEELNLTEIADLLDYSSVAHLSSQFKRETGMTPTEFKGMSAPGRTPIDAI